MINKVVPFLLSILVLNGCGNSQIEELFDKDKEPVSTIDKASDEQAGLDRHNQIRAEVFSNSPLAWSDEIAVLAQNYANKLAANGRFEHDSAKYKYSYGENLYASKKPLNEIATYEEAVNSWYVEKDYYDYDTNSCSIDKDHKVTVNSSSYDTCGHYTQIVWKKTSYVGCGKAQYTTGDYKGGYVIVCKYYTPGNYVGQKPY
jgi:pathogenesis-related protein 1